MKQQRHKLVLNLFSKTMYSEHITTMIIEGDKSMREPSELCFKIQVIGHDI
jgi:hypothetical protein